MRNPTRAEKLLLPPLIAMALVLQIPHRALLVVQDLGAQALENVANSVITVVNNTGEIVSTGRYATPLPVNTFVRIDPLRFRDMVPEKGDSSYLVYFWAKNNCGFGALVDVRKPELRELTKFQPDESKRRIELPQAIGLKFDSAYVVSVEDEGHTTLALKVSRQRQAKCFGEDHPH